MATRPAPAKKAPAKKSAAKTPAAAAPKSKPVTTRAEIRLPLLWIGVLAGQVRGSLAAASGVETADEVIKYLLAGADTVMTTSALLRHGIEHMRGLLRGLVEWLETHDLGGIGDVRGKLSHRRVADPTAFERGNYISVLHSWSGGHRP